MPRRLARPKQHGLIGKMDGEDIGRGSGTGPDPPGGNMPQPAAPVVALVRIIRRRIEKRSALRAGKIGHGSPVVAVFREPGILRECWRVGQGGEIHSFDAPRSRGGPFLPLSLQGEAGWG